jgi:hypothetical protein
MLVVPWHPNSGSTDDLEMVVQQIRELIQQLLQQAEARQRFDAAG